MRTKALWLAGVFLCLLLFCGADPLSLEPTEVPVASFDGGQFRYISEQNSRIYVAAGNTLWSFDHKGGNVSTVYSSGRVRSCTVVGSSAYFITDTGIGFSFEEHSVYGGLIRSAENIIDPALYGYVTAMTIGDDGNVWFIVKDKELWFCNTYTGDYSLAHKFSKAVSSLHFVDSCLWAVSGSRVYFCEGTDRVDASSYMDLAAKALAFYDGGIYVDHNGNFCSGRSVLFSSTVPDVGGVSHYSDGIYAYWQLENNTAVKTDLSGNVVAKYKTDGTICVLCDKGLVTVKEGRLYFAQYDSAPLPTATPVPTKAPEESKTESSEVVDDRNELPENTDHLIFDAGTKVTDVVSSMKCEVWFEGSKVTSGHLRSGMVAKYEGREVLIVVTGDVNGSGTVNSADFKAMQEHLLGTEKLSGAYLLAADISGDGSVGTEDLVLILKKF